MELAEPGICFTGLAAALGVPGVAVASVADFVDALKLGLKSDHPLLIEVRTDPAFR
jgi:thiamine pyrophosphate-dependent acetolactate synthase large subunit-like protein